MNEVRAHMERLGFSLTETGGGCTAYERVNSVDESTLLVTAHGEPSAPETMEEPVTLGFYNSVGAPVANIALTSVKAITCAY